MKSCTTICNDCPFSKNSIKGFLGGYTIETLIEFYSNEVLFPCHKQIKDEDNIVNNIKEKVINEEHKLCRGYLECIAKSCKLPRDRELSEEVLKVKGKLSDNSMSIFEFNIHHVPTNK